MIRPIIIGVVGITIAAAAGVADAGMAERVVAGLASVAEYDGELCATAQRLLVNAYGNESSEDFAIRLKRATGRGFNAAQMDIDADNRTINVAMMTMTAQIDGDSSGHGDELATYVACKMVNQARVNDMLQLEFSGSPRSCRDVNEHTYRLALATLSSEQRRRYESAGRQLRFVDDDVASGGSEWIPAVVNDFIRSVDSEENSGYLEIQAPSAQVSWDPVSRDWFRGTHHCKLITLAAMQKWMTDGALNGESEMFPRGTQICESPSSMSSQVGSCVFYFGPAGSIYCQDYTGPAWTIGLAQTECGIRHATESAWLAAGKRYAGEGGFYSPLSCAARDITVRFQGTCVFHCNERDEALWHILSTTSVDFQGPGMERPCDLFIPAGR